MADMIKSSTMEAENESNSITMQGAMIQTSSNLMIGITNLPVVDNLQEANARMNACNESYKNLLRSHAESISKLGSEFDTFDKNLADCMGISSK